ncbi:MAG: hypothetical protein LBU53_02950 [Zoogloeaceae bacterium]|jgi:predicted O-linked N-acetylglucosamine transferase (SPINDLY family)|nr:hypothetical protein [Zoogloeaceae bacterium]
MNHPYYIFALDFVVRSEGTRACHRLCHVLNTAGEEAWIFGAEVLNPTLNTPVLTREICMQHEAEGRRAIGVYPDIVRSNLFNTPVVVHWMLNRDGLITGHKINAGKDDLFFYYLPDFAPGPEENYDYLCLVLQDLELFKPAPEQVKQRPLLYLNRIPESEIDFSVFPPDIEILSNRRPVSLPRLAEKFQTATRVYTYEFSGTITLAMLCECPVVILRHPDYAQYGYTPEVIARYPENGKVFALSDAVEEIESTREYLPKIRQALINKTKQFRQRQLPLFIQKTQAAASNAVAGQHIPSRAYFLAWKTVRILLGKAQRALNDNDVDTARALLETALQTDPNEPLVHVALALVAAHTDHMDTAKDFIFSALKLSSGNPSFLARNNEAVALLQKLARHPSDTQTNLYALLVNILAERGDITGFVDYFRNFPTTLGNLLLTVKTLAHYEESGEQLQATLKKIRTELALPVIGNAAPLPLTLPRKIKIVFMAGNFAREKSLGRLLPLLQYLPSEQFSTCLVSCTPQNHDYLNLCAASAHKFLAIHQDDDQTAIKRIQAFQADIMIDLDTYDPMERLPVFASLAVPHKLHWGETPLPPLMPDTQILTGACLDVQNILPTTSLLLLPEMGEFYALPDIPLAANAPLHATGATVFGCLTPTIRIGQNGWSLFAEVLQHNPQSRLILNLEDLGEAAEVFIQDQFAHAGIATERLTFVRASTTTELCGHWRAIDLGLAAPVDSGDMALPTCLWMGRPYLALGIPLLPWSQRPIALLKTAGATGWVAKTRDDYIKLACKPVPAPNPDFRARLQALTDPVRFAEGFAATLLNLISSQP